MSWAGTASVVLGATSSYMSAKQAAKAAGAQAALSRKAAAEMRARAVESSAATKAEIANLKAVRAMDMPALRQAGEVSMRKAAAAAERTNRVRTLGRTTGSVRDQLFGHQFQSYIARESQRLGRFTELTKHIMGATERQQQLANDVEARAGGLEFRGQMEAIKMRAATPNATAQILSAVGSAASAFAKTKSDSKRRKEAEARSDARDQASRDFWAEQFKNRTAAAGGPPMPGTPDLEAFWKDLAAVPNSGFKYVGPNQ